MVLSFYSQIFAPSPQTPAALSYFCVYRPLTPQRILGVLFLQPQVCQRTNKQPLTPQAANSLMVWREMPKTQYVVC